MLPQAHNYAPNQAHNYVSRTPISIRPRRPQRGLGSAARNL